MSEKVGNVEDDEGSDQDVSEVETGTQPAAFGFGLARNRGLSTALLGLGLLGMVVALLLPWSTAGGSAQGLAQYGAPEPSLIAWILLALGLATAIVGAGSFAFGSDGALAAIAVGAFLYLIGVGLWYVASILPGVVASGCNSNGGPLCNVPAGSPVVSSASVGSGFILAIVAAVFAIALSILAATSSRWATRQ
jgi:hypothetical protein